MATQSKSTSPATPATQATSGIPRSLSAAKARGYATADIKFSDLPDAHKARFAQLDDAGARRGSLCGIAPSTDDAFWLVCYKQNGGQCTWVHVPKGSPIPDHG